ncbi:MAG: toll/interleukin-1 receptor domain-containing protein [Acidobacteriota bacterium]
MAVLHFVTRIVTSQRQCYAPRAANALHAVSGTQFLYATVFKQHMAYLPGFEHDILISYAHLDENGEDQWVSRFHRRLEAELKRLAGRDLTIWRDLRLDKNQLFDQTIKTAVERAGLFLALNSHAYADSEYCKQEVQWFCDKAQSKAHKDGLGLSIGDRKRIFNVRLNNLPPNEWHPAFGGATGYPFFEEIPGDDIALVCDPDSPQFKAQIRDLTRDVFRTLRAFKQEILNRQPDETSPASPMGNGAETAEASILLDTHMKDDVQAIEVHRALRGLNVKTYFNQSEDNPGESVRILETRLRQTGRMIIVFDSVEESWVLGRLGLVSEIANKEQAAMKLGIYYGPQRRKGNGGQIRLGSLTVYEFDDADLRNPQSLLPLLS